MNSIYKIIVVFIFLFLNLQASEFCSIEQYNKENPSQIKISKDFKEIVKNNAVPINIENKKEVKIVVVYPGDQISDYWRRSITSFTKRMDQLNIKYSVKEHFTKPAIELSKQALHISKALCEDVDYLIYTLDIKKHTKFIERILSHNKPKLILQNITTPLKRWKKRQPFLYVGFDHIQGSVILANYYIDILKNKGNYAVMYGSQGYVSDMRGKEFIKYMDKNSNFKLLDTYYTNFKLKDAYNATIDLVERRKDIDFIYACSTDIAFGVKDALKDKKLLGKIKVNGWGGGENELEAIKLKELDLTVMRINDDNGVAMAEAIKLDITKQRDKVPTIFAGDFDIVTKQTPQEEIELLKKKAFRYSK